MKVNEEVIIKNIRHKILNSNFSNNSRKRLSGSPCRIDSRASVLSPIYDYRDYLGMSIRLAQGIFSYPLLKESWIKDVGEEGKAFGRLVNDNIYYLVDKPGYNKENIITPGGIYLELFDAFFDEDDLLLPFYLSELANTLFPMILYIFFCFNTNDGTVYSFTDMIEDPDETGYCPVVRVPATILKALETESRPMIYIALTSQNSFEEKDFWTMTGTNLLNKPCNYSDEEVVEEHDDEDQ